MSTQIKANTTHRLKRYLRILVVIWTFLCVAALAWDISHIKVSPDDFASQQQAHILIHAATMFILWFLGMIGLIWAGRRLTTQLHRQEQAEIALRQERQLFVSGPAVIFKWQNKSGWPVEYVSDNVTEALGYSPAQFLSETVSYADLIHPDDLARVLAEVQDGSRADSDRFTHQPYRLRNADGEFIWLTDHTTLLRDSAGQITHYLGYIIDITDRVRAEQSLRESEERLNLVLDGAKLGLWDWNIQTGKVVFNERWADMLGHTLDEIEPHIDSWRMQMHPNDRAAVMGVLQDHLAGRIPVYQTEHRVRHKSGRWVWVFDSGKVVEWDAAGQPLRAAGIHMDITEQREGEAARQALTSRLETLIQSLQSGILMEDARRKVALHNEGFNLIFGLPPSLSLMGEDCAAAAEEMKAMFVNADRFSPRIAEIIQQQQPVLGEELDTMDGRVLERDYVPVYAEGQLAGHLWHYRDITQWVRSREQIKASLREKEVLLKEIHHRVKNNLQIVASLLYLQAKHLDDPVALTALQESRSRVRVMALIHEQLYQSKNLAAIDFQSYLSSLTGYLSQTYRPQDGRVAVNVQAHNIKLEVDTAITLGLIVNELVSNALKHAFTSNLSGRVDVELTTTDPGNYTLTVRDNGAGFPSDAIERLSMAGMAALARGSLGMQLVDTLVTQIEGKVTAFNNGGAVVTVTFSTQV